jgi:hypothetical protein
MSETDSEFCQTSEQQVRHSHFTVSGSAHLIGNEQDLSIKSTFCGRRENILGESGGLWGEFITFAAK